MTRSKIQKMKFFVFLLIFLLAQTVHCDASFREKKATSKIVDKDKDKDKANNGKINEPVAVAVAAAAAAAAASSVHKNGDQQDAQVGFTNPKTRPATDTGNRTFDDALSKPSVSDITVAAANKTVHSVNTSDEHSNTTFNTGALVRGFLVFVGLSILVMAYIVFRSFRLSKTRAQMVRKYGVLTHRQDVEMRPLPLEEEDDEDTTVFDASNVLSNNIQHQNA